MTGFHAKRFDTSEPNSARVYNCLLGGKSFYAVDALLVNEILNINPHAQAIALHNRDFMLRAARFMAESGIRQFIDLGSGIPASPTVHEVVREVAPDCRVIYADNKDEAVTETRYLLRDVDGVEVIAADARLPHDTVFNHPTVQELIDLEQPVGIVLAAVLHFFLSEDDPHGVMREYVRWLPAGSCIAISHATIPPGKNAVVEEAVKIYQRSSDPGTARTREEFVQFFDGLDIIEPGVQYCADWRPTQPVDESDPARPWLYAAVGRKTLK